MSKESILITDSEDFTEIDICNGLAQLGATQYELEEAHKQIIKIHNMLNCGVYREDIFATISEYCRVYLDKEQKCELL